MDEKATPSPKVDKDSSNKAEEPFILRIIQQQFIKILSMFFR
jgi:hypothetical protein